MNKYLINLLGTAAPWKVIKCHSLSCSPHHGQGPRSLPRKDTICILRPPKKSLVAKSSVKLVLVLPSRTY